MSTRHLIAAAFLLAFFLVSSCGSDEPKPAPEGQGQEEVASHKETGSAPRPKGPNASKYTAKEKRMAKAQFKAYCSTCHGATGKGDGLAGQAYDPKPRNYHDQEWQNKVTDEHLFNVIKDGGAKWGLSSNMQPNPLYQDKPGVIWALVDLVRSYKK